MFAIVKIAGQQFRVQKNQTLYVPHIDAENSLERTNKKFIKRFTEMEQRALKQGKALSEMTLGEMDAIWNSIKKQNTGT